MHNTEIRGRLGQKRFADRIPQLAGCILKIGKLYLGGVHLCRTVQTRETSGGSNLSVGEYMGPARSSQIRGLRGETSCRVRFDLYLPCHGAGSSPHIITSLYLVTTSGQLT